MKYFKLTLFLIFITQTILGQSDESRFELSGYGEILFKHFDYGPNQRATEKGSTKENRSVIDIPRITFEAEYKFLNDLYLVSEIEFEHLGTGSALELEYEEFGEYEFESEKGGEVQIEELYLNKSFSNYFNIRAGRFPVPLALFNKRHEPLDYFTTGFPEAHTSILPAEWNETGLEIYGNLKMISYRLAVVNGLDASGFSSERWIADGYQTKFEQISITNPAYVLNVDFEGINDLLAGGSFYIGNSAGNRPKPEDMNGIDAYVSIYNFHLFYSGNPFIFRGDFIYGNLENSGIVSQRNARLSVNTQNVRTPVAKNAMAWYAETGYNIAAVFNIPVNYQLYPFIRYEYYNSMEKTEPGIFANERFKRNVITGGLNLVWNDELILKVDYSSRKVGNGKYNTENSFGIAIGYNATFIK